MEADRLIPVQGCWVIKLDEKRRLGCVRGYRNTKHKIEIHVEWNPNTSEWVALEKLGSGFQNGWTVQDVPISNTRKPLGEGRVIGRRELGGRQQVLVQLYKDGSSVWLAYENLVRIKDPQMRYVRAEVKGEDHSQRFRLKLLAHALENWNYLTGSLDRLDVDPLPHQIQLVHRILSSGNYNWLIADDVGLGKTIEMGLLLAALKRKGQARRVLIVAPAGLTRQWQDELEYKFQLQYLIFGQDFYINNPNQWKLYDHVIVSVDMAKRPERMAVFSQADSWDIIVFDEGHKLTRYATGKRSERYQLAEMLRGKSDALFLLSGTPHQGYEDRFCALLELVRPDLKKQIDALHFHPEVVSDIILRNQKSEVTDAEGNFIFKGHRVDRIPIKPSKETLDFQVLLRKYLTQGYKAGEGNKRRAIGFVMTIYRKLASSSISAIEHALKLRRARLEIQETVNNDSLTPNPQTDFETEDIFEGGDDQDDLANRTSDTQPKEFFRFEKKLIDELLSKAEIVRRNDEKLTTFIEQVAHHILNNAKKLLVFTEYRATQLYLKENLERAFPNAGKVLLFNGSMSLDEKLKAIETFNHGPNRLLISTEAGGEGLNLHHACHTMVNYDLPWNPARLVQRMGRLYRYGQTEPVIVVNLHAQDSFDNAAIDLMLQRVATIASAMAPIGSEFNDRLHSEILGNILEQLDFAAILRSSVSMEMKHTEKEIEQAIVQAKHAKQLQDEIFTHISGYDPNALQGTLGFTMQHVNTFVLNMLPFIGAKIEHGKHDMASIQIRIPETLRGQFPEFANRTVVRITADRRQASRSRDLVLLDFETPFFKYLVETAKSQKFDGIYASIRSLVKEGTLGAFKLRWQNDQGEPRTEEFITLFTDEEGNVETNPAFIASLLVNGPESVPVCRPLAKEEIEQRTQRLNSLTYKAQQCLAEKSDRFKHPNGLVPLAFADLND